MDIDVGKLSAVTVLSWNIKLGLETKRAVDELHLIPTIPSPDIVLLQEMDENGTRAVADSFAADYVYHCLGQHRNTGRNFGNSVLSRWPIIDSKVVRLPHQLPVFGYPRFALRATVEIAGRPLVTYSVHAAHWKLRLAKRIEQFTAVANDVTAIPDLPVVVGGDWNTVTRRGVDALVSTMASVDLHHVSADSGPTFKLAGTQTTLDHIFARGLAFVACGVEDKAMASDHLPLWVRLRHVS